MREECSMHLRKTSFGYNSLPTRGIPQSAKPIHTYSFPCILLHQTTIPTNWMGKEG